MLYLGRLEPNEMYVVDLIQEESGRRYVRVRPAGESKHEHTALESKVYSGRVLNDFASNRQISEDVTTIDGEPFGLDPHDSWMTLTEAKYWRENRSQQALEDENAPWVNGKPPLFAPA